MKRWIGRLLLSAAGILMGLVLAELGMRVYHYFKYGVSLEQAIRNPAPMPKSGRTKLLIHLIRLSRNPRIVYELRPNLSVIFRASPGDIDTKVTTSAAGFRSKEYSEDKAPGTFRIVGLGDSLMFGWGVADGEDYLSVLERNLNAKFPQRKWEVINTAVPGYNTAMEVETLKQKGLRYHPDLVIVGWCDNDLDLPNFIRNDERYFSMRVSFLAQFLNHIASHPAGGGMMSAPKTPDGKAFDDTPARVPAAYRDIVGGDAVVRGFAELKELGERNGFKTIVVPFMNGGRAPSMIDLASKMRFPVIDVGKREEELMHSTNFDLLCVNGLCAGTDDPHPSRKAHQMAADEILDYIAATNHLEREQKLSGMSQATAGSR